MASAPSACSTRKVRARSGLRNTSPATGGRPSIYHAATESGSSLVQQPFSGSAGGSTQSEALRWLTGNPSRASASAGASTSSRDCAAQPSARAPRSAVQAGAASPVAQGDKSGACWAMSGVAQMPVTLIATAIAVRHQTRLRCVTASPLGSMLTDVWHQAALAKQKRAGPGTRRAFYSLNVRALRGQLGARRLLALVRIEEALAQADRLGGHLDHLVVVDIGDGLFQSHLVRRGQADRVVLAARGAEVGQLLGLHRVDLEVVRFGVLDEHNAL